MKHLSPAIAALLAAGLFSGHALALTKDEYKAAKDRIEATYKSEKADCRSLKGNAEDVCKEEAEGKEKVAKAELKAQYEPTARNQEKAREARADATYKVAKEKCDDLNGDAKSSCEKAAKDTHKSDLAAARAAK